jgi:NADH:ubiquinone oxidoreductase subunit F (NADH-binding)
VVCNADEGEPGCFKDQALMDHDPHALLEGMALACLATGAERAFIYLRYEYPETALVLERALDEAREAGILGDDVMGTGRRIRIHLRRGAGAYICGEETSLLNSLEGRHPFPRNRPPYPTTNGYDDRPTVVNNVETLCSVPPIVLRGAGWYRDLGLGRTSGPRSSRSAET